MSRFLALLALAGGCFYTDPINQRPSIAINGLGDEVYRGDTVELTETHDDPEGNFVRFTWRAYACTDGEGGADCDVEPFYTEILNHAEFVVPFKRDAGLPVRNVRVVLEAKDELGATAKPPQELVIVTLDRPPGLELAREGTFVMTPGRPVILNATISDVDDGVDSLGTPTWEVFAPSQVPYTLEDIEAKGTPKMGTKTFAKKFTPSASGDWEVRVIATDPLDKSTMKSFVLSVVPPPPPCLAQLAPIVPPAGALLPITEPKLFQVLVVVDDLDVFPAQADLGHTRFEWWTKGPGASSYTVVGGATSNAFSFDPAAYTPGDQVDVRVQIYDRENTAVNCPATDPSCSVISQPTCIQRQTWRVEVR